MIIFKRRQKRSFHPTSRQIKRYACVGAVALLLFFAIFGMCSRAAARARLARARDLLAKPDLSERDLKIAEARLHRALVRQAVGSGK